MKNECGTFYKLYVILIVIGLLGQKLTNLTCELFGKCLHWNKWTNKCQCSWSDWLKKLQRNSSPYRSAKNNDFIFIKPQLVFYKIINYFCFLIDNLSSWLAFMNTITWVLHSKNIYLKFISTNYLVWISQMIHQFMTQFNILSTGMKIN